MKKRGQLPDAHTFTLLLRGLADHPQYSSAVCRAMSLYNSMLKPTSPVKPSIIHTNAVLTVCARHKDMDTLWTVLEKVPEMGPNAPDAWTWTVILNAIREEIITRPGDDPSKNTVDQVDDGEGEDITTQATARNAEEQVKREQTILRARRIWDGVIQRWRRGIVHMDAQLVQAMGMVLLASSRERNWDDVFSLVEQTMGIPRMIPKWTPPSAKKPRRDEEEDSKRMKESTQDEHDGNSNEDINSSTRMSSDEYGSEFDTRIGDSPSTDTAAYARPTQATLSMLLEASRLLRSNKAATGYWILLTSSHDDSQQPRTATGVNTKSFNILPDADNYHSYLRVLRLMRSSFKAVSALEEMVSRSREDRRRHGGRQGQSQFQPARKTFLITMSVCARDKRNPQQLSHATRVLELMSSCLADPDVSTLTRYFDLAHGLNDEQALRGALEGLHPLVTNLRGMLTYGRARDVKPVDHRTRDAALMLMRRMLGAYGRLLGRRDEMRREENKRLKTQQASLRKFVERVEKREEGVE